MSLDVLKKIRVEEGITQLQLANMLKKPQSFVSKYESGERRIDVQEFIYICKALQKAPSEVIKDIEKDITYGC
jgi:transcriptional regulator with XRE-family HTH domain